MKRKEDAATDFSFALKVKSQVPIVCPGHTRPLTELHYSAATPDGVFLISGCHDKLPMLRRGDNGDWIGTYAGHKGAVWSAKLDSSALLAATGSADFSAKLWDAVSGEELATFSHKHIVKCVEFDPFEPGQAQAQWLASGGAEGRLRVFDLAAGALASEIETRPPADAKRGLNKVVWGPTRSTILTAGADGVVRMWDVRGGTVAREVAVGAVEGASSVAVMDVELTTPRAGPRAGKPTLVCAAGEHATILDAASLETVARFDLGVRALFKEEGGVSLHPDGERFIAGGSDLMVRVLDAASGAELESHQGHHGPVRHCRYAPDGASYVTGSEDGTIRLWQTVPEPAAPTSGAEPAEGGSGAA